MGSGKRTGPSSDLAVASVVLSVNRVGLVDGARENNKARAVVEIYRIPLKRGDAPGLYPLDATKTKIENWTFPNQAI